MGKPPFSIGKIAPTPKLVDQFFNDSTGEGDHGEVDARGPWNEGEPWEFVESPPSRNLNGTGEMDLPPSMPKAPIRMDRKLIKELSGRSAARHPACRKATSEGAAEDGQGGAFGPAAKLVRNPSSGNREPRSSG